MAKPAQSKRTKHKKQNHKEVIKCSRYGHPESSHRRKEPKPRRKEITPMNSLMISHHEGW